MPRYYIAKEKFKIVSKRDIQKYVDATEDYEMKIVLALTWLTGLRISEVLSIKPENVFMKDKKLYLSVKAKKHGKIAYPVFSIDDPFVKPIIAYIETFDDEEAIFLRGKRTFQQKLLDLNKELWGANTTKYITFHYLRHSRLTFLARKLGARPEQFKSWTGHQSNAFEEYFAPRKLEEFAGKFKES
jgi:integrase